MGNVRRHGRGFHTLEIIDVGNVENRNTEENLDLGQPGTGLWQSVAEHPYYEKRNSQSHAETCHQADAAQCGFGRVDVAGQLGTCPLAGNVKQNGSRNRADTWRNDETSGRAHQECAEKSVPSARRGVQFGYEWCKKLKFIEPDHA